MELWWWRFNRSADGQHVHTMGLWRWQFNGSVVDSPSTRWSFGGGGLIAQLMDSTSTRWDFGGGGLIAQSCLTLCELMDRSPSGSSVRGIFPAEILERVAISRSSS